MLAIMSKQLHQRIALPLLRHVLETFNAGAMTSEQACSELCLSRSRLFAIRKEWLSAIRRGEDWKPSGSGGAHKAPWTEELKAFLRQALSTRPPASFAFAASEAVRLGLAARLDRAQVRLWAISQGLSRPKPKDRASCHTRRWQRLNVGELWQLDATPYRWFGEGSECLPMLNMLDDASRRQVGGKVYAHENLAAYIDFLKESFERFGLPLQIYVDQASFFKSQDGRHLTRLASRLKFYGVTLVFANSPESKGKIERRHQIWQDRLPAHFARIGAPADLDKANSEIWPLVVWNSEHDLNRETGMTGVEAWDKAVRDGRNKLRPKPAEPWWEYVWSVIEPTVVGKGRRVRIGLDEVTVNAPVGSRAYLCSHTDGSHSIVKDYPKHGTYPVVLFTDRKHPKDNTDEATIVHF
jgi:hypothetical protein